MLGGRASCLFTELQGLCRCSGGGSAGASPQGGSWVLSLGEAELRSLQDDYAHLLSEKLI